MNIRPISLNLLKQYVFLSQKKYRQKYNKFILEGEKIILELISEHPALCECILVEENSMDKFPWLKNSLPSPLYTISTHQLSKLSSMKTPPAVLAVCHIPSNVDPSTSKLQDASYFYLDQIKDPGNLGTILRIAEWFGFGGVICSPETVDPFNPKVVQASMGSILRVPILLASISESKTCLPDLPIIALDMEGQSLQSENTPEKGIYIIGSESHGISDEIRPWVDAYVTIPRYSQTNFPESLNAASAAAIVGYAVSARK